MIDGCFNGGFQVRKIDPADELMIMNDFGSNVNLVVNGESLTQEQIVSKFYYSNDAFEKMKNNDFVINKSKPFKKEIELSDDLKPLEPGQVDPAAFFGNSMKGLF